MILPADNEDVVIDPIFLSLRDRFGAEGGQRMSVRYRTLIDQASYAFQMGQWRTLRRAAEETNDFNELDRLDRLYENIGI